MKALASKKQGNIDKRGKGCRLHDDERGGVVLKKEKGQNTNEFYCLIRNTIKLVEEPYLKNLEGAQLSGTKTFPRSKKVSKFVGCRRR